MVQVRQLSALTPEESAARSRYVSDARFFHAASQGLLSLVQSDYEFNKIRSFLAEDVRALDAATRKFELTEPDIVYSGHGNQLGVIGSLRAASVSDYVGLRYQYNGFISTSSRRDVADRFIRANEGMGVLPVLMEFHLPDGFNVLDMSYAANAGEQEFLVGRSVEFEVFGSTNAGVPQAQKSALHLLLKPA